MASSPRLSSGVRSESRRTPPPVSAVTPGTGTGRGTGLGKSEAERRSSEVFARAHEFACRVLPDQNVTFVGSAWLAERYRLRRDPSRDEVVARLKGNGRWIGG